MLERQEPLVRAGLVTSSRIDTALDSNGRNYRQLWVTQGKALWSAGQELGVLAQSAARLQEDSVAEGAELQFAVPDRRKDARTRRSNTCFENRCT
jgi:hypothetical protein